MFRVHSQHVDTSTGFHVIELRDEHGARHLVQIAVGHQSCAACGAVYPKDDLGEIDPKAAVAKITAELDCSLKNIAEYATRHSVRMK
jgi:hypothetical protein